MQNLRPIVISVFFLPIIFMGACAETNIDGDNSVSNSAANNRSNAEIIPLDDIEALEKIVKLPFVPEEVIYTETNPNSNSSSPQESLVVDKKLTAVLQFSRENAEQLAAQAEKHRLPVSSNLDAESWFPPELIAKSQETGDDYLKGIEYAANDFLQAPYSKGKLTRVNNTNYFLLELTSF